MKLVVRLLLLLLVVAALVGGWLWYAIKTPYQAFSKEGVFIDVPHGASQRTVARLLQRNGVIRSAVAFEIYARRHAKRGLQAGEYFFDQPITAENVYRKLANGDIYEQPFTVREGETMFEIAKELQDAKYMSAEEFLAAAKNPELIAGIAPEAKTLEGFLFPATYHLPRKPVPTELVADMVRKFKDTWAELDPGGDKTGIAQGRPVLAVVTLASLVERETPKPEERPLVAGVFSNRLRREMLLQCDPTVIYALDRVGKYRGMLTLTDLRFDSPYNTYVHTGLPPGPIGNPGEQSLRAALDPAQTEYLYFVANTQGGHFFSATLEGHNQNVVRYHRLLRGEAVDPPVPLDASKGRGEHSGNHR